MMLLRQETNRERRSKLRKKALRIMDPQVFPSEKKAVINWSHSSLAGAKEGHRLKQNNLKSSLTRLRPNSQQDTKVRAGSSLKFSTPWSQVRNQFFKQKVVPNSIVLYCREQRWDRTDEHYYADVGYAMHSACILFSVYNIHIKL